MLAIPILGNSATPFQKTPESGNKFKIYQILWNNDIIINSSNETQVVPKGNLYPRFREEERPKVKKM